MKLSGVTVLLTRTEEDNQQLACRLRTLGAAIIENPLIDIRFLAASVVRELAQQPWDGLLVTSGNALRALHRLLDEPVLRGLPRCYVVGKRTAGIAAELGLTAVHPNEVRTAKDLASFLRQDKPWQGRGRFLWPHGQLADVAEMTDELRELDIDLVDVACYATTTKSITPQTAAQLRDCKNGVVVFYSPSAVRAFIDSEGVSELVSSSSLRIVTIGPKTAKAIDAAGLSVAGVAVRPELESIVHTILDAKQRSG